MRRFETSVTSPGRQPALAARGGGSARPRTAAFPTWAEQDRQYQSAEPAPNCPPSPLVGGPAHRPPRSQPPRGTSMAWERRWEDLHPPRGPPPRRANLLRSAASPAPDPSSPQAHGKFLRTWGAPQPRRDRQVLGQKQQDGGSGQEDRKLPQSPHTERAHGGAQDSHPAALPHITARRSGSQAIERNLKGAGTARRGVENNKMYRPRRPGTSAEPPHQASPRRNATSTAY